MTNVHLGERVPTCLPAQGPWVCPSGCMHLCSPCLCRELSRRPVSSRVGRERDSAREGHGQGCLFRALTVIADPEALREKTLGPVLDEKVQNRVPFRIQEAPDAVTLLQNVVGTLAEAVTVESAVRRGRR